MRKLFLSFLLLSGLFKAHAQGNIIKANLSSLAFKTVYLSYERTFLKRFSINLGFDFMPNRGIPFANQLGDLNGYANPAEGMKLNGWQITPEFRVYTSIVKGSPRGFYIAPYLRYTTYSLDYKGYEYHYNDTYDNDQPKVAHVDLTGTFSAIGGGIMIGHQWIVGKHVAIDFWIAGLGLNSSQFQLRATSNDLDKRYFTDNSSLTIDIESNLKLFNKTSFTMGNNYAQANSNGLLVGIRGLGFNIGFAF